MNQRDVWDSIAEAWEKYRKIPFQEFKKFIKSKKGLVLDIGCGTGRNLVKINGSYVCIDFSINMLKLAKKKIKASFVLADASSLPFKENVFDAVIFHSVLHCLKKKQRLSALSEMKRVMKPSSSAFISVWNKDSGEKLVSWTYKGKKYMRYYYFFTKDELEKTLNKIGFKSIKVQLDEKEKNIIAIVEK